MIGGTALLFAWALVEAAIARNFHRAGDTHSACLHRDFALAMAAIGAGLGGLTWIAR